jgi:hypothetical protein
MKNRLTDFELDQKLTAYMQSGRDICFQPDKQRIFALAGLGAEAGVGTRAWSWCKSRPETNDTSRTKTHRPRNLRRLWPVAAAAMLLIVSTLAIPPIRAAITNIFTFIPGVGIVVDADSTIYAVVPSVGRIENENGAYAEIHAAYYQKGRIVVIVSGAGIRVPNTGYTLFANGIGVETSVGGHDAHGSETGYSFSGYIQYKTKPPESGDAFEVEIAGFSQRLAFTLEPCADYDDLSRIGPTDTHNGISITAVAERNGDELKVWYYVLREPGAPSDQIYAFGGSVMYNSVHVVYEDPNNPGVVYDDYSPGYATVYVHDPWRYVDEYGTNHIVTESGAKILRTSINHNLFFVSYNDFSLQTYEMPDGDQDATLHIPYLHMVDTLSLSSEKKKATVDIPKGYEAVECNIPIELSIGTLTVTKIERSDDTQRRFGTSKKWQGMDTLIISFDMESKDPNVVFYNFRADSDLWNGDGGSSSGDGKTGSYTVAVKPNATKHTFTIYNLEYLLLGEYVIPLEIG